MTIAEFTRIQDLAKAAKTGDILCHEIVSTMGLDERWDNTLINGSEIFDLALNYCDSTDDNEKSKLLSELLKKLCVQRVLPLN